MSSNVNEVIKTIQFFKRSKALAFVRMYGSTNTSLVGPPYPTVRLQRFVLLIG